MLRGCYHFYNNNVVVFLMCNQSQFTTWHMLVCKFDVDNVSAWLCGAVGHFTGAIFYVLTVNVHFAGSFNREAQSTIAWQGQKKQT